jgi:hypothetical protein
LTATCPTCGESPCRQSCPEERARQAAGTVLVRRIIRREEGGSTVFRSADDALRVYFTILHHRAAPKSIPMQRESGPPGRGPDGPGLQKVHAVGPAIAKAERDDRERNPARPAPIETWLALTYLGSGRRLGLSAEEIADRFPGWTTHEVNTRIARARRVIRNWLKGRHMRRDETDGEETAADHFAEAARLTAEGAVAATTRALEALGKRGMTAAERAQIEAARATTNGPAVVIVIEDPSDEE